MRSRFEMCAAAFGHVRAHLRGNIGGGEERKNTVYSERRGETFFLVVVMFIAVA